MRWRRQYMDSHLAMHLRTGYKGMQQLFFFFVLFKPVKIQQIINAKTVSG